MGTGLFAPIYRLFAQSGPKLPSDDFAKSHAIFRRGLFEHSKVWPAPIVMLGDSIIEHAPWSELIGNPRIVNRGVAGDTSDAILNRASGIVAMEPSRVVLMVGTADIISGVNVDAIVANAKRILETLGGVPVLFVMPPPISQKHRGEAAEMATLRSTYHGTLTDFRGVDVLDMTKDLSDGQGYLQDRFSLDGYHLTADAYFIIAQALEPFTALSHDLVDVDVRVQRAAENP